MDCKRNLRFEIGDDFLLDGKPFKIISGAIHYFRVVPAYWRDRLLKLKAMGCNTVETYVAWNVHEPQKDHFTFDGWADIEQFIEIARELGLWVILRPGPYICAEWELGGLPPWLLAEDGMRLRSRHPSFLRHVRDFWQALIPRMVPFQIDNDGPIILVQVENEYGHYGDDTLYLEILRDMLREMGITVPFVTSDSPQTPLLTAGSVEGALATANYGTGSAEKLDILDDVLKKSNGGPTMCMEFWVGWFDHWGSDHNTASYEINVRELTEILHRGSVNFYMFHGGTNFGFMNGANYTDHLLPDVTSYDYDAPLAEDGRITPKFEKFREYLSNYHDISQPLPTPAPVAAYGTFPVINKVSLFNTLEKISSPVDHFHPLAMEKLSQNYGYTLYQSTVDCETMDTIELTETADRAQLFLNKKHVLTLYDVELAQQHPVNREGEIFELDILMENMGRVNFGPKMNRQQKGIKGDVLINGRPHSGWRHWPLSFAQSSIEKIDFLGEWEENQPGFYQIIFYAEVAADTFLELSGWGKGCVFLNGFNLGRFWNKGPQKRLYIPAPLLKEGENTLVVFETEGVFGDSVAFFDQPDLG